MTPQWETFINGKVCRNLIELSDRTVWHLKQHSYQDYHKLSGRFVSEFGMHGYPDMRTVYEFAPNSEDRFPQSKTIDCHNKGHGAEVRIARYLAENFRYSQNLEDYAYASQLLQSEAYFYALRDWKRKFCGKGKEYCAGAIIWQVRYSKLVHR
jgi:beta-mannosidase